MRAWLCALVLAGCGDATPPPAPHAPQASGDLGGDVVASVDDDAIVAATVARIAHAQGVDPAEARERAIYDALWAAGARDALPEPLIRRETTRVLAHAMTRALWLEQRDLPIRDEELAEATEALWTRYDRPPGKRTIHVVVRVDEGAPAERVDAARALAERIRQALVPVADEARGTAPPAYDEEAMFRLGSDPPDPAKAPWEAAVASVDPEGFRVLPQVVQPITADGLPIDHDQPLDASYFDETYAAEVAKLAARGDMTPVFRSYAGFHTAMLLENTPDKRVGRAERLVALRDDILRNRARRARRALLERIAADTRVEVPVNADALLALVRVSGEP